MRITLARTFSCGSCNPRSLQKASRPGATRDHHRLAGDTAPLGHGGSHAPARRLEAAHGAVREDGRAGAPGRGCDGGSCFLRLGPSSESQ